MVVEHSCLQMRTGDDRARKHTSSGALVGTWKCVTGCGAPGKTVKQHKYRTRLDSEHPSRASLVCVFAVANFAIAAWWAIHITFGRRTERQSTRPLIVRLVVHVHRHVSSAMTTHQPDPKLLTQSSLLQTTTDQSAATQHT